jgi:hypothetical protein
MENQFSFSITVEGLWHVLKSYENDIKGKLNAFKNLDYRYKKFLENELKLIQQTKLYAFDKLSEFFMNHAYIVVDQDNEQDKKGLLQCESLQSLGYDE